MKFLKTLIIPTLSIGLIACGGESKKQPSESEASTQERTEEKNDLKGMEEIDLSSYDLMASIFVPNGSKGKTEISTTDWGSIEILQGDSYGVEITPFGMTVSEKKTELEGDLVYEIKYLKEEANLILYSKTIKDSEIDPEVHFFMTKEINGNLVELKSMNNAYREKQIEKMISSAESLTAKKAS